MPHTSNSNTVQIVAHNREWASTCAPYAQAGASPLVLGPKAETSGSMNTNPVAFALRLTLGSAAGFYYFLVRVYLQFYANLLCGCALWLHLFA